MDSTDGPRRAIEIAHRRSGKDLNIWNIFIKETQKRIGAYWYLFPEMTMARRTIWEGKTSDGVPFLSYIPKELIVSKRNNDMTIQLTNGSTIHLLGSDRFDSLVGANPVGVVMSEFALSNPAAYQYVAPILAANDGWFIANTTPRGKNHAFDLLKNVASSPDWFCRVLTVDDTSKIVDGRRLPVVSKDRIQRDIDDGTPKELVAQEYYCSFDSGQVGSFYSEGMDRVSKEKRIVEENIFNPNYKVYTAWDIGIADSMSIWYFQVYDDKTHLIEYNEFEGSSVIECCHIVNGTFDELKDFCDEKTIESHKLKYASHKQYRYAEHFGPHDLKQRDKGNGISTIVTASKHGIAFRIVPKTTIMDGINNVRKILPHTIFCRKFCERGIHCLRDYRKKYDSTKKMFMDEPYHDWASHGADAFRYLAQAVVTFIDNEFLKKALRRTVVKNYSKSTIVSKRDLQEDYDRRLQIRIEEMEQNRDFDGEHYAVKD